MIASAIAAVTALVGAVIAWQLVGSLRARSVGTLRLLDRTLVNVQDSIGIAADVLDTVDTSFVTMQATLAAVGKSVDDASTTLDAVAELTETIPPSLDNVDTALGNFSEAASVVDDAVGRIGDLPVLPSFDTDLSGSIDDVRDTLKPISTSLRDSVTSIRGLSTSSTELNDHVTQLQADISDLADSIKESKTVITKYRDDAEDARSMTAASLDELSTQMMLSRVLVVVLAITIAVGQIAPYRIGRQLYDGT